MDQSYGTVASFVTAEEELSAYGPAVSDTGLRKYSLEREEKEAAILSACKASDVAALAALAASEGGFLTEHLRQRAWLILLGLNHCEAGNEQADESRTETSIAAWKSLPPHKDEDQVQLDVDRAFVYYPKDLSKSQLDERRKELREIIVSTLRQHPMLCYFQGYHDIVQVMMLVLGLEKASTATERLSILRIRDFMLPSLSASLVHLQLLPAILSSTDPELYRHLADVRTHFALAAALTMYAHEVEEYSQIARLFDFLLAHEAAISMYLFASIIISHRKELLEIPIEEPDMLTWKLTKIPGKLDIESAISACIQLYARIPPEKLPFRTWQKISAYSVLKTTRKKQGGVTTLNTAMTLAEGEGIFTKQANQLRRQEECQRLTRLVWRHRRSIGGFTFAVFVGLFSIWMQRQGYGAFGWLSRPVWGLLDRIQKGRQ